MKIEKLEDLIAWQEARKFCKIIYAMTENFPKSEDYNLKKHLRESARGVAANIAEGFGRYFFKENMRFYGIARGCLMEVKSDLYVSFDARYISNEDLEKNIHNLEVVKIKINALIGNVKNAMKNPEKDLKNEINWE